MKRKDLIKGLGFTALGSLGFINKAFSTPNPQQFYASWTHGNNLTVESPENLDSVGHYGWGGDMLIKPGKSSWFHIPIPTPVIVNGNRSLLQRVFIMFQCTQCSIRNLHVYDGSSKVQEFNNLMYDGEHRTSLDTQNTYNLSNQHIVIWGIGITFFCVADIGFDSKIPPPRLILGAAGGDFMA